LNPVGGALVGAAAVEPNPKKKPKEEKRYT